MKKVKEMENKYTAFNGSIQIASGTIRVVAEAAKLLIDGGESITILIFNDTTGVQIDLDFSGTLTDVFSRLKQQFELNQDLPESRSQDKNKAKPGRPKLGVVSKEVTLLPRHWEWLAGQPGGASVTLRKLVEQAKRTNQGEDKIRRSREATFKFINAIAGNLPGFEEAVRALFAGDVERFSQQIGSWPKSIQEYSQKLSADAFGK